MTAGEVAALVPAVIGLVLALTAWLRAEVANTKLSQHAQLWHVNTTRTTTARPHDDGQRQ